MRARSDFGLIKRKVNGKTVYYYYVYDESNKRVYRSTGERTKAKALDYVLEQRDKGKLGQKDRCMMSLKDFTEDFFVYERCPIVRNAVMHGKHVTKATCDTRRRALDLHILPHLGKLPVSSVTKARINTWLIELPSKDKVSMSTANGSYDCLRQVMDEAVRQGLIHANPCDKVERLGNDSKRRDAFTVKEVWQILGEPEDWSNILVRLMCFTAAMTGMRVGEVRALKPECITDTAIHIKASYSEMDGYKTPKNGKERVAPIPPELRDQLRFFSPKDGGYIFRVVGEKPISNDYVNRVLKRRMKDTGIDGKGKSFHSFRSFFNTEMEADNVNEAIIRSVIGHQNVSMTEHYLHLETGEFTSVRETQDRILAAKDA